MRPFTSLRFLRGILFLIVAALVALLWGVVAAGFVTPNWVAAFISGSIVGAALWQAVKEVM